MVKINLLPDLRQAKLRDQRRRRLIVASGVGVCIVVAGVVVLLLVLRTSQLLLISSTNSTINSRQQRLEGIGGIQAAVNAQQALNTLPNLYVQRNYYTQLLEVVSALQPSGLFIATIQNSNSSGIEINGNAGSYTEVATFAKALSTGTPNTTQFSSAAPFQDVAITSAAQSGAQVTFSITATINPQVLQNGN